MATRFCFAPAPTFPVVAQHMMSQMSREQHLPKAISMYVLGKSVYKLKNLGNSEYYPPVEIHQQNDILKVTSRIANGL